MVNLSSAGEKTGRLIEVLCPTVDNTRQVVQRIAPSARIVYVGNDPMVLAHSRALKTGPGTTVIQADIRDPDAILNHPETRRLIDFGQPLAVMFIAVLHFLSDDDAPHAVVARFLDAAAPGSYLALSHVATDPDLRQAADVTAVYAGTTSPATPRAHADILAFFDGLDLAEPGLVPVSQWRPDQPADSQHGWILGGIGRRPADLDGTPHSRGEQAGAVRVRLAARQEPQRRYRGGLEVGARHRAAGDA